jgi:hypothetical protein
LLILAYTIFSFWRNLKHIYFFLAKKAIKTTEKVFILLALVSLVSIFPNLCLAHLQVHFTFFYFFLSNFTNHITKERRLNPSFRICIYITDLCFYKDLKTTYFKRTYIKRNYSESIIIISSFKIL